MTLLQAAILEWSGVEWLYLIGAAFKNSERETELSTPFSTKIRGLRIRNHVISSKNTIN